MKWKLNDGDGDPASDLMSGGGDGGVAASVRAGHEKAAFVAVELDAGENTERAKWMVAEVVMVPAEEVEVADDECGEANGYLREDSLLTDLVERVAGADFVAVFVAAADGDGYGETDVTCDGYYST